MFILNAVCGDTLVYVKDYDTFGKIKINTRSRRGEIKWGGSVQKSQ